MPRALRPREKHVSREGTFLSNSTLCQSRAQHVSREGTFLFNRTLCRSRAGGSESIKKATLLIKKIDLQNEKWAANQSILRGVKALAIESGLESKENQIITVGDL
jgi:hypothetical protein